MASPEPIPTHTPNRRSFNSSAGTAHDVCDSHGHQMPRASPPATRASAPFAILDTMYQGIQTILRRRSDHQFPRARRRLGQPGQWHVFHRPVARSTSRCSRISPRTPMSSISTSSRTSSATTSNTISRAPTTSAAPTALGDKLDPRVAFGEGFGYAFAAIVLNDPVARDSCVNGTTRDLGLAFQRGNQSVRPRPVGAQTTNYGCWCSESSVWSILWDLYDNAADANDTLALGFTPIWNVLTGAQRTTPAFTTIFSFITATQKPEPAGDAARHRYARRRAEHRRHQYRHVWHGRNPCRRRSTAAAALPLYTVSTAVGGPAVVRAQRG